jgi:ABC-2 type transport system permease protein
LIRQVVAVALNELQLVWQDRPALALLFLMPAFFIVVMSFALENVFEAGTRERPLSVLVIDEDGGPVAARVVRTLEAAPGIDAITRIEGVSLDREDAERRVTERTHPMALLLPAGLSDPPRDPAAAPVVALIVDPATQRQIIAPVRGAVEGVLRMTLVLERLPGDLRELVTEWSIEEGEGVPPPDLLEELEQSYSDRLARLEARAGASVDVRFPAGLEPPSRPTATQQSVPAYAIFGVFFIAHTLATSFVRERADGTLRRLMVTPLSRAALLLGKLLPYVLLNLVQIALMFAVGVLLFDLELGSPLALLGLSLATSGAATGLGLCVAALGRTEAQVGALAVSISIILAALGGLMVPSYVMPGAMRSLAAATPHAWALQGYHDVMLRGASLRAVLSEIAILTGFALAFFCAAASRFRFR